MGGKPRGRPREPERGESPAPWRALEEKINAMLLEAEMAAVIVNEEFVGALFPETTTPDALIGARYLLSDLAAVQHRKLRGAIQELREARDAFEAHVAQPAEAAAGGRR